MNCRYVRNYLQGQEPEWIEEREWREREGEDIPPWMDEAEIVALEYDDEDPWINEG